MVENKLTNSFSKVNVSIIVPVYNVENYLKECIESILNQTYKDFELILVNDGSIDKSGEICDEYAKKYSNIKVIHQENQGQAVARNNGVKYSHSDWIMFVDSDDIIHQNSLEYLYRAVVESNAGMAVSDRISGNTVPADFYKVNEFSYEVDEVTNSKIEEYYDENKYYYWAPFPSIIRKDIVVSLPFPSGRIYEDNAVSCQLVYSAKKVAKLPFVTYFYRNNPNSTMNAHLSEKKLDYLWALESQIQFYIDIKCDNMVRKMSDNLIETAFYFHSIALKEKNKDIEKIILKKIRNILKTYSNYISIDKKDRNKIFKIYHPFLFKLKKRFKL